MKKTLHLLVGLIMVISSTSCKKDTPEPEPAKKTTAELFFGAWELISVTNSAGSAVTLSTADKTDVYTYKSDGTFAFTHANGSSFFSGTWKIENADKTLTFLPTGAGASSQTILSITATQMQLQNSAGDKLVFNKK